MPLSSLVCYTSIYLSLHISFFGPLNPSTSCSSLFVFLRLMIFVFGSFVHVICQQSRSYTHELKRFLFASFFAAVDDCNYNNMSWQKQMHKETGITHKQIKIKWIWRTIILHLYLSVLSTFKKDGSRIFDFALFGCNETNFAF